MNSRPDTSSFSVSRGRPTYGTLMQRAWKLSCPRCGEGPLFKSRFRMHERCDHCQFKFDRGPGYYLGSIYINYGLTTLLSTVAFLVCVLSLGIDKNFVLPPLMVFTILFPMLLFRFARAWWLAMDCHFDPEVLADSSNSDDSE